MRSTTPDRPPLEPLSVLVLSAAAQTAEVVRIALERVPDVAVASETAELARGADLLREYTPDLAVVALDGAARCALAVVETIHHAAPSMTILVLSAGDAPETTLRALHAGATECLPLPPAPADLATVLTKVARLKRLAVADGERRGQLWSVVGPKEGVGATTLVANLGVELCATFGRSVVLVDLDLERGELALFLNLNPPASLPHVALDTQRLDPVFLEAALARHPAGPYVLAAPLDAAATTPALTAAALGAVLDLLRARHDIVIVDAPPPLGDAVSAAVRTSNRVLLPTELTVPCLRAAWRTIERLGPLGIPPIPLEVIATKYTPRHATMSLVEARRTLKVPFTHVLPRDDVAHDAANRGLPLADVDPAAPLRTAIMTLASDLAALGAEEPKPGRWRHSL